MYADLKFLRYLNHRMSHASQPCPRSAIYIEDVFICCEQKSQQKQNGVTMLL